MILLTTFSENEVFSIFLKSKNFFWEQKTIGLICDGKCILDFFFFRDSFCLLMKMILKMIEKSCGKILIIITHSQYFEILNN